MSIGAFAEKGHQPRMEEVFEALGSMRSAWTELAQHIRENFGAREEFKFYGKNYGWALRFRKGGKALVSLYPGKDTFTVQVILRQEAAEKALSLNLGKHVRQVIQEAHPYPEGRWLFIPVKSDADIAAAQKLLSLKAPSNLRRRR